MRAVTYDSYGSPAILTHSTLETPSPSSDQVLVKVHAAGINPYDWHLYRGEPYVVRPQSGLRRPKHRTTVGADFAGEVVAVGAEVPGFAPGDKVFGSVGDGACAEFVLATPDKMAPMPASATFTQAAALPMAALTAYQGLRDTAKLEAGQSVLINGASGGVGHVAVQIAKAMGASTVTAVCSGKNAHWLLGIGADEALDYTRADFTTLSRQYDVIYDTAGGHGITAVRRALTPHGRYALAGSTSRGKLLGPARHMFGSLIAGVFVSQKVGIVSAKTSSADLATIAAWVDEGLVGAVIDQTFTLERAADAFSYLEEGHVAGKVVITMPL